MNARATALPSRLHGLDTLRAIAILIVMLYHFRIQGLVPHALEGVAGIGWIGVDLFFVLSGFLIGSQLLQAHRDRRFRLHDFYARRAFRILPAFAVVLLLYVAVPAWRESPALYAPWQYATFTWNLLLLHYPEAHAFSHVWSLCVEEHFYLVLPLLLLRVRRPSAPVVYGVACAVMVGGVALRYWLLQHVVLVADDDAQRSLLMRYLYYPTYARLDGLAVGAALACARVLQPHVWSMLVRRSAALSTCGVGLLVGGLWMCGFNYPDPDLTWSVTGAYPMLALGFGCLVAAASSSGGWVGRRIPGCAWVASLAYGLYLTHKSVASIMHRLLHADENAATWGALAVYFAACFVIALLLFALVERPCLRLRDRRQRLATPLLDQEIRLDPAI